MLIDKVSSDEDIGMRRPSDLVGEGVKTPTVEVGSKETIELSNVKISIDVDTSTGDSEVIILLVKIGKNIELVSSTKELSLNVLIERDNSDVGRGIRTLVVLTGVETTVVKTSLMPDVNVKSICEEVKGNGSKMSEDATVNWKELSINDEDEGSTVGEESTSIVDAMLKETRGVVADGVMIIITAVVSPIGSSVSTRLLAAGREELLVCFSVDEDTIIEEIGGRFEVDINMDLG